jgi:hypothetical protein
MTGRTAIRFQDVGFADLGCRRPRVRRPALFVESDHPRLPAPPDRGRGQSAATDLRHRQRTGETDHQLTLAWAAECAARGVFVHPKHNWFMSTALTEADVDIVLEATDAAYGVVAKRL